MWLVYIVHVTRMYTFLLFAFRELLSWFHSPGCPRHKRHVRDAVYTNTNQTSLHLHSTLGRWLESFSSWIARDLNTSRHIQCTACRHVFSIRLAVIPSSVPVVYAMFKALYTLAIFVRLDRRRIAVVSFVFSRSVSLHFHWTINNFQSSKKRSSIFLRLCVWRRLSIRR